MMSKYILARGMTPLLFSIVNQVPKQRLPLLAHHQTAVITTKNNKDQQQKNLLNKKEAKKTSTYVNLERLIMLLNKQSKQSDSQQEKKWLPQEKQELSFKKIFSNPLTETEKDYEDHRVKVNENKVETLIDLINSTTSGIANVSFFFIFDDQKIMVMFENGDRKIINPDGSIFFEQSNVKKIDFTLGIPPTMCMVLHDDDAFQLITMAKNPDNFETILHLDHVDHYHFMHEFNFKKIMITFKNSDRKIINPDGSTFFEQKNVKKISFKLGNPPATSTVLHHNDIFRLIKLGNTPNSFETLLRLEKVDRYYFMREFNFKKIMLVFKNNDEIILNSDGSTFKENEDDLKVASND